METLDAFSSAYPLDILIADDDAHERAEIKELLAELGYNPDEASSSADIIRLAGARKYDVILMDIRIPGLEYVLDAPNSQPGHRPIIIALAGATVTDFRISCLKTRMDSFIAQPMQQKELLLQLKACSLLAGKCSVRSGK
jgi:CheY-like chemotaxis protein